MSFRKLNPNSSMASFSPRNHLLLFLIFSVFHVIRFSCHGATEKEKTLAMIKPDGMYGNYDSQIKNIVLQSGFSIVREKRIQLNEDTAGSFYVEHSSKSFFPSVIKYMTSGPVLIMVLEKENAVAEWRNLIGPTDAKKAKVTHPNSIRALCGASTERNCVHGSDSVHSASREISFFFDVEETRHDEL